MEYILYSTPVQLRTMTVQVPPISMYHMRKLLELRDSGTDLDNPDAKGLFAVINLLTEIIKENHPEMTPEVLEKEIDATNLAKVMAAIQGMPKNAIAQTGTQVNQNLSEETKTIE